MTRVKCPDYQECFRAEADLADKTRLFEMACYQLGVIAGYYESSEKLSPAARAKRFFTDNRIKPMGQPALPFLGEAEKGS